MSDLSNYSNPLITSWFDQSVQIKNEQVTVINNSAILGGVPDPYRKVQLNQGFSEVQEGENLVGNQYYVDYSTGLITFSSDIVDGTTLNANYYSRGQVLVPAARVYTNTTNPDAGSNIQDMIDNYNNLNGVDLYTKFDPNAGHDHSGTSGNGPQISANNIMVQDSNNVFNSRNVEDALYEVEQKTETNKFDIATNSGNISDNKTNIGNLPSLKTSSKNDLVSSINENYNNISTNTTSINNAKGNYPTLKDKINAYAVDIVDFYASGSDQTTTGSITSGSTTLTVSPMIDFEVNQGIAISGAGLSGGLLVSSINSISGTTITLKDAADVTVSNANVQHDDTTAFQNAINSIPSVGGDIIAPVATYNISSTLVLPTDYRPITFMGTGGRDDTVTTPSGTRLNWQGGNNTSVIKASNNLTLKTMLISNINNATGVTCIDYWNDTSNPKSNNYIENIFIKGFDVGIALQNTWYNSFLNCFISHCNVGIKLGDNANSSSFYTCHIARGGTGVQTVGGALEILFSGCSFEHCSTIALDLTSAYYNFSFLDSYFEYNNQTAKIDGVCTVINNAYVNHDVPPSGNACFEVQTYNPTTLDNIRFSSDIPTNQGFSYTGDTTTHVAGLSIGKTFGQYYFSDFLLNNLDTFENNILDMEQSNVKIIETDILDASVAQSYYYIPPNCNYGVVNRRLVAIYLEIYETINIGSGNITIRCGNSGSAYDQYVNVTYSTNQVPGLIKLATPNDTLYPQSKYYMFNNTAATSGKYRLKFLIAN